MRRVLAPLLACLLWAAPLHALEPGFAGSQSCRDCHEKFYKIWSTSHHGLAMQSFDAAKATLTPQAKALAVRGARFQMDLAAGVLIERGPSGEKRYPVVQAVVLERAGLVDAARKRDFANPPAMLAYLERSDRQEVFAASLIRLLRACPDPAKWPGIRTAASDPSPLVRAATATALGSDPNPRSTAVLARLAADPLRLVRVRAAESLAGRLERPLQPRQSAPGPGRRPRGPGGLRPGRGAAAQGDAPGALAAYGRAVELRPDAAPPRVNAALVLAQRGDLAGTESSLRQAVEADPTSAAARFNLGLLLAETKRPAEAEKELRAALAANPLLAQAAYNLGMMLLEKKPGESVKFLAQAAKLRPDEARFGHALGYAQHQRGDDAAAAKTLAQVIHLHPDAAESYRLLAGIYEKRGEKRKLHDLCEDAQTAPGLNPLVQAMLRNKLNELNQEQKK